MWRRRHSRKPRKIILKIFLFGSILAISVLGFLIIRLKPFTIKYVEVEIKNGCVAEDQVKETLNILGHNLFLINTTKVEDKLKEKFICLHSVILSKYFPDKIKLQAYSRQPAAVLVSLKDELATPSSILENISTPSANIVQEYFLIDIEGVIFKKGTDDLDIPKIYMKDSGSSFGKTTNRVIKALEILEKVKTFGLEFKKSWISGEFFIINPETTKPKIIFLLDNEVNAQLASLQLILAEAKMNRGTISSDDERNHRTIPSEAGIDLKELEFVDLRFDKPVIKFAPHRKN